MAMQEVYSNPIAPAEDDRSAVLTNDDFRKLLNTPRVRTTSTTSDDATVKPTMLPVERKFHDDKRQKKKSLYMKLREVEEERDKELALKYRDRARERRDGANPDYPTTADMFASAGMYKAVAPDVDPFKAEELRKRVIQESKYLGGDMKHTHLVKGLDYALLQKVRSEITSKEQEEEIITALEKKRETEKGPSVPAADEDVTFKSRMAKQIFRALFQSKPPEKNELFHPGRMAYVFELDDEYAESDIPTTLIRSKTDCPNLESHTTLSTNDIVINKLTQIISYLRQGARHPGKKGKKRGKTREERHLSRKMAAADDNIYSGIGDYIFDPKQSAAAKNQKVSFDKPVVKEDKPVSTSATEIVKSIHAQFSSMDAPKQVKSSSTTVAGLTDEQLKAGWAPADIEWMKQQQLGFDPTAPTTSATRREESQKSKRKTSLHESNANSYAECYPGALEELDATYDSDNEADYTKMDMGNKKGPVKRWDFDTEDDYSAYQSKREAMPKAAFQYGVKMNDGRKTRRYPKGGDEKAKLDREWQKISAIISKRGGSNLLGSSSKKARVE
ncbi:protein Red-like [Dysidea avara]|uniref:protein Red-like n=1 Tax=Dysidea avara TaxID=196820 RepID=UPI0033256F99